MTAYQQLGYNSLMWYTGLPLRHSLPNPIVVCTNDRTCSLSSVIAKLSYMFSHWSRPHVCLAIYAILRGWVSCTQFQQNWLISGHVFAVNSISCSPGFDNLTFHLIAQLCFLGERLHWYNERGHHDVRGFHLIYLPPAKPHKTNFSLHSL